MDKVAEVFSENNPNDPVNGKDRKQYLQLQLQLREYNNKDPEKKQEKYFNSFFIRQLFHRAITGIQLSI